MADINKATENIKRLMDLGLYSHVLGVLYLFSLRKDKNAFLMNINRQIEELLNSLSDDESKELAGDVKRMMVKKADELLDEMEKVASDGEIDELLGQLKESVSLGK